MTSQKTRKETILKRKKWSIYCSEVSKMRIEEKKTRFTDIEAF